MLADEFVRILRTFADQPEDVDISKGELLLQIHEDVIEAKVSQRAGELYVEEQDTEWRAADWIIKRIARVPLLADRIITYVNQPEYFVTPSGSLLDQLEYVQSDNDVRDIAIDDASEETRKILARRPAGTSTVLYLTSDAGEGKTTLINYLARVQAQAFKERKTDWLLVPIPLGGRGFLRFDDVVVAALANRLRFQWWYFDSFLELVRLGVVVPAFDGFEEMFIEGSSGEAVSALGNLMRSLQSQGSVLIAARKAYFEYQSFRTQARLFDSIGSSSVSFARLGIRRWARDKFGEYCLKRHIANSDAIYDIVANRLSPDHPLLTRPVLVRRLLDVVETLKDINGLVQQLGDTPRDYFFQFVNAIVEREAKEKWLTKTGEMQELLVTVQEHYELLCMIAQEMWLSSTDALKPEVLDVIADIFSEARSKGPAIARQIKERLKQHSLITSAATVRGAFSFDHEDFRKFFLGEAIGRLLLKGKREDLQGVLGVAALPKETGNHAVQYFRREKGAAPKALRLIQEISLSELPTSFIRENAGALTMWLLDGEDSASLIIEQMNFPSEALAGKSFCNVFFKKCYFQPTPLTQLALRQCVFQDCEFERLEIADGVNVGGARLENCQIRALVLLTKDEQVFDPAAIESKLLQFGFITKSRITDAQPHQHPEADDKIKLVERFLRIFLRATYVTENVIRLRLGHSGGLFLANVLPELMKAGIVMETDYLGSGSQRRFKLGVPMEELEMALSHCEGKFSEFLREFSAPARK
jgi:hypothetical protein